MKHIDTGEHALNKPDHSHQGHQAHTHGEGCGHRKVQHGDHLDYEIEGSVECDPAKDDGSLRPVNLPLSGSFIVEGVIHYLQPSESD